MTPWRACPNRTRRGSVGGALTDRYPALRMLTRARRALHRFAGLMERKRVNASRIRSVGYDERNQVLEVELSNGSVWQYARVSPEVHRRFMAAPNPTAFFDDRIAEEYTARRV